MSSDQFPTGPEGESTHVDLASENLKLKRALGELETLHEIAVVSGKASGLDDLMRSIVTRVVKALSAQECVITLVSNETKARQTLVRAQLSSATKPGYSVTEALTGWVLETRKSFVCNDPKNDVRLAFAHRQEHVTNILSVPLSRREGLIGLITVFNKKGGLPFSSDDERLLSIIASQVGPILDRARVEEDRSRIVAIFGQHVPGAVVDLLVKNGPDVATERHNVCVMFLDIRGFSRFAETRSPEEVVHYLNSLFSFMIDIVNRHHGIVHQLLGDGFMAVFGAPLKVGNEIENAVHAALEILDQLRSHVESGSIRPTRLSIGLHAGQVVAGTVGAANRKEYKVTGDVVNVAARVEQMNRQYDSEFLISKDVYDGLGPDRPDVTVVGEVPVRGREAPIQLFRVV